jgi:uncharacterized protein DUF1670
MTTVALRKQGEFLPLRGYVMDMGSFPTHKAAVIRLYLQGMLTPDIAARTYHSKEAVDRYIRGFDRVRLLASKFSKEELPLLSGIRSSSSSSTSSSCPTMPRRRGNRMPRPRRRSGSERSGPLTVGAPPGSWSAGRPDRGTAGHGRGVRGARALRCPGRGCGARRTGWRSTDQATYFS